MIRSDVPPLEECTGCFPTWLQHFLVSPQRLGVTAVLHVSPLCCRCSGGMNWYHIWVWFASLWWLTISSIFLYAYWPFYFRETSIQSLWSFLNWAAHPFLIMLRSPLCVLMQDPYQVYNLQTSPHVLREIFSVSWWALHFLLMMQNKRSPELSTGRLTSTAGL